MLKTLAFVVGVVLGAGSVGGCSVVRLQSAGATCDDRAAAAAVELIAFLEAGAAQVESQAAALTDAPVELSTTRPEVPATPTVDSLAALNDDVACGEPGWANDSIRAELDAEFERRVLAFGDREEFDVREHAFLNTLAVYSMSLSAPPTFDVPGTLPPQLPVHPDAVLGQAAGLEAHWEVPVSAAPYEDVRQFYEGALQQGIPGRWSVAAAPQSSTADVTGAVWGGATFHVTGYSYAGTVAVQRLPDAPSTTIDVTLHPAD